MVQTSLYGSVKLGWLEELIIREHFVFQNKNQEQKKKKNHFVVPGMVLCNLHISPKFRCILEFVFAW